VHCAHAEEIECASLAQPGHGLGPVTRPGLLGLAQSKKLNKNRKIKKCVCINKNNVNLLVYSLTSESGIKIPV
jgi:hypothetical protein